MKRIPEKELMTKEEVREYNRIAPIIQKNGIAFFRKNLEDIEGKKTILCVGSGTAIILVSITSLNKNFKIVGIDLSNEMNKIARKNVKNKGLSSRIKIRKMDAKKMKFKSNSFDIVISNDFLHHMKEPFKVLNEIKKVIKKHGLILLRDVLRPGSKKELDTILRARIIKRGAEAKKSEKMARKSAMSGFTVPEIKTYLKKADIKNYKIEEEKLKGFLPRLRVIIC